VISVVNDEGRKFNVAVVMPGERYGNSYMRDSRGLLPLVNEYGEALVEFYDAKQEGNVAFDAQGRGQFVSRYTLSVLDGTSEYARSSPYGIQLDGGIPVWRITAENVADAVAYAYQVLAEADALTGIS
jgi:hypothetical protein